MRLVVTTMKDEGPFMLEWVAHYLSIGFDHFIIATNDCSDGTDEIAKRLETIGLASHVNNPGPWEKGPQGGAYAKAMAHPKFAEADWILVADADEFLDLRAGDGTLDALFAELPDANLISFNWRLFGHNGRVDFEDAFVTDQFTRAAHAHQQWPVMCRALKTLYHRDAGFAELSTHRPKMPTRGWQDRVVWRDADGDEMGPVFGQWGWHGTNAGIGFGTRLGRMNHYAVRSIGSYLMKRLRGDVRTGIYHPKLEASGVEYWALHCWNSVVEEGITRHRARLAAAVARLRSDPVLASLHDAAVAHHQGNIATLMETEAAQNFVTTFRDYTGAFDGALEQFGIICPDLAVEMSKTGRLGYASRLKNARQASVKFARSHHKLPWFADADATGVDFGLGRGGTRSDDPSLAPLDAQPFVGDNQITHGAKPKRRRVRQAFLAELGQRKRHWAVLGSADPALIRDIQREVDPGQLLVVNAWGYRSDLFPIRRKDRAPDRARVAQDLDWLGFVDGFQARLKSGRLRVIRAEPYFALKTLPPEHFDAIYLAGGLPGAPSDRPLERVLSRLATGGLLILDGYHRRGPSGDALQVALHELLAAHAGQLRIRAIEGAHCAVEHLAPLAHSA